MDKEFAKYNSAAKHSGSSTLLKSASAILGGLAALTVTQPALSAVPPTFSIITPSEFNLPVPEPGEGINFFFQNAVHTDDSERYNADGERVDNPTGDSTFLGVTRFGRLFSLESTPNVGYYWEVLLPQVHVNLDEDAFNNPADGQSISGFADPLVALTVYTRPIPNFLIGLENFFSAPIGDNALSFDYYTYQPNIIFDYSSPTGFGVDGLVGFAFKTDNDSNNADPGTDFYFDLRLRYQVNDWLIPAVSYDYQKTSGQSDAQGASIPDAEQHIVGGGAQVIFNEAGTVFGSAAYRVGVDGKNTTRVDGPYARFVYLF